MTAVTPVAGLPALGTGHENESSYLAMPNGTERSNLIAELRECAGRPVRLRLDDGSEHHGVLRTDLLTERSISIFIENETGEGATIYIEQIAEIRPQS